MWYVSPPEIDEIREWLRSLERGSLWFWSPRFDDGASVTMAVVRRRYNAAIIEKCAQVVDRYPGGGMQQVDIIKLALAAAIRELKD